MNLQNVFVQLVNAGLQVYLAITFYSLFTKQKCNSKLMIPLGIMLSIFMGIGLFFFRGNVIVYIFTLLPTLILTFFFKNTILSKIISFILYNALGIISEMLTASFSALIMGISFGNINGAPYIMGMLMSKIIVFIIIILIRSFKRRNSFDLYKTGGIKAFMFPLSSLLTMIIQYFMLLKGNIIQNTQLSYFLLISYTILIVSNMLMFDYIDSIYTHADDKEKIAVANEIIAQQTIQYNDLIKHNEDIIKIQHDSKHFYMGLISLIEQEKYSDAIGQLKQLYNESDHALIKSGSIIHSIVELMKTEAKKYNTEIDFSYTQLNEIKILPTDLAIVLGNALKNAIEACSKLNDDNKKTIQLFIRPQNDTIIITVTNPVSENIDVSNLVSDKSDKEHHGYGIISMKKIVSKYGGDIVFTCTNNIFVVSIVMNNETVKHE